MFRPEKHLGFSIFRFIILYFSIFVFLSIFQFVICQIFDFRNYWFSRFWCLKKSYFSKKNRLPNFDNNIIFFKFQFLDFSYSWHSSFFKFRWYKFFRVFYYAFSNFIFLKLYISWIFQFPVFMNYGSTMVIIL